MGTTGATKRHAIATAASRPHPLHGLILADHLPEALRADLVPALECLVRQVRPQGLWLFGSWARGTASRRSDVDLLVLGQVPERLLDAYDAVLEALWDCPLPLQPLVVRREVLVRHSDTPFWRAVRVEAVPLLAGSRFP
jgi:hypothetical protein